MRKSLLVALIFIAVGVAVTSCTDENVKPQTNEGGGQGGAYDPKGPR